MVISGRYRGSIGSSVQVRGRVCGRPVAFEVSTQPQGRRSRPAIGQIWARMRIAELANRATYRQQIGGLADEIKQTALSYNLMSAYTAFVAIDSSRLTDGSYGTAVPVPVPVPKGVRHQTTVSGR